MAERVGKELSDYSRQQVLSCPALPETLFLERNAGFGEKGLKRCTELLSDDPSNHHLSLCGLRREIPSLARFLVRSSSQRQPGTRDDPTSS